MPHISKTAAKNPDKAAIIMPGSGKVVTYQQLDNSSNQVAHLLRKIGLQTGDHISLIMENRSEFLEIYLGAMRAGLIVTPVNAHLQLQECKYIIENSNSKLLVCSEKYRPLAQQLTSLTTAVDHFYCLEGGGSLADWGKELAAQAEHPITDEARGWVMMYSSGTTGHPKGILGVVEGVSLDDLHPVLESMAQAFGISQDTTYLSPGPLYHAAPLGWCDMVLNKGGTVVVMEKFDAEKALSQIEQYKVSHSQWVPIMFIRMLKLPEAQRLSYDLGSLKVAVHAAAPCPIEVKEQMIAWWGEVIYEYYAASEAIGSTAIDSQNWLAHKGSVGKASYGKIHIVDDDNKLLEHDQIGQIYFESDATNFEYYGEPGKTKGSFNPSGWATVGDVGYLDQEGYLYLTDRKSFMIISGGVNIYPQEIENCLIINDKVADVAVFGVPNAEFGEEVCAVVQLADGINTDDELSQELIDWCKNKISRIKAPRQLHFIDQLPRLENGKLYKRRLVEKYS